MKSGQGTLTWGARTKLLGHKYVGNFKNDKQNGQGTYTYADGTVYVGTFKDDFIAGQGTKTWPDGTQYVGAFEVNERIEDELHLILNI